jgi:hypothetical protein
MCSQPRGNTVYVLIEDVRNPSKAFPLQRPNPSQHKTDFQGRRLTFLLYSSAGLRGSVDVSPLTDTPELHNECSSPAIFAIPTNQQQWKELRVKSLQAEGGNVRSKSQITTGGTSRLQRRPAHPQLNNGRQNSISTKFAY